MKWTQTILVIFRRHWRPLALMATGLALLYSALGFLLLPWWLERVAPRFVADELGQELVIGQIRFNPWTLVLDVENLALRERDGAELAGFAQLRVNMQLSSLWFRGVALREIVLRSPSVNVVVEADGSLNLARVRPPPPAGEADDASADRAPLRLRIDRLAVENGTISFEDYSQASDFQKVLEPINFELNHFNTATASANSFELEATTLIGERLSWAGRFDLRPLRSSGRIAIRDGKPESLWAYLEEATAFRVASGTVDLDCDYAVMLDRELELRLAIPKIVLRELSIRPDADDTEETWIALAQTDVVDTQFDLTARTLSVGELRVSEPALTVWRDTDGRINILQLAGEADASSGPPAHDSKVAEPWTVTLARFAVVGGTIDWTDRAVSPEAPIRLAPVTVTLSDISSDLSLPIGLELELGIAGSARLAASGSVNPQARAGELMLELTGLPLVPFQPYVARSADLQIRSGSAALAGRLAFADQDTSPKLSFEGSLSVEDLATIDNALEEDLLKWKRLTLDGLSVQLDPNSLGIEKITAEEPYVRAIVSSAGQLNLTQVLRADEADTSAARDDRDSKRAATRSLPIRIEQVTIRDGSADFADFAVQPDFSAGIQSLNGSVSGLSSAADARARVDLKGSVGRYSPVTIAGEVNPLAAETFLDLEMKFSNIELPIFNPYSGKFAGYNIAKGKLTTELDYRVENRRLVADHKIVIDQLEFGEETGSEDAVPLPLELAVALLKDRHGVIDLELPVTGDLDDPEFRFGPIVWKAFVGLIKKIVTAPFALLGSIFGGGGEELSYLDFPAGSAALTSTAIDKIATLGRALTERPGLKLDVPAAALREIDAPVMLEQEFDERLAAALSVLGTTAQPTSPENQLKALEYVYRAVTGLDPVYPEPEPAAAVAAGSQAPQAEPSVDPTAHRREYLEREIRGALSVTDSALKQLGQTRAEGVVAALLAAGDIAPERIFVATRQAVKAGDDQSVRLELELK